MSNMTKRGRGRPRVTSRATLVEAASELFLEKSFENTTALEIAKRAGLSRNTFFNYFEKQTDLLWDPFDTKLELLIAEVEGLSTLVSPDSDEHCSYVKAIERVSTRFIAFATEYESRDIPLCIREYQAMGTGEAIIDTTPDRVTRLAKVIFRKLNNMVARPRAIAISSALAAGFVWSFVGWAQDPSSEPFPDLVGNKPQTIY